MVHAPSPSLSGVRGWRVRTLRGYRRVIRALDFRQDSMSRESVTMIRADVAAWRSDPTMARALAEMCEAATGQRLSADSRARGEWMEEALLAAFRRGALVLVSEGLAARQSEGGGGGALPDTPAPPAAAAKSSAVSDEPPPPRPSTEKTWFRARLLDEDGEPMANEDYVLLDSEGARREGKLDENGEVYIPPILPPGKCSISFPKIHLNPRKRS